MAPKRLTLQLFILFEILHNVPCLSEDGKPLQRFGWVGSGTSLPCTVDVQSCGGLHSIKWYRGSTRIYVFSGKRNFSNPEGEYAGRAIMSYQQDQKNSSLILKNVSVSDEAVYKCEITYLDVVENCHVVQFIQLSTLIPPNSINITREDGEIVTNGTSLGPINEGSLIVLSCLVSEGKPIPSVTWYNGSKEIRGTQEITSGPNGIGAAKNVLQITVSRNDLYSKYRCEASSNAILQPMMVTFQIDVNVKPLSMSLEGIGGPVLENTLVSLKCSVYGGKPKPSMQWYNNSELIENKDIINRTTINNADRTIDYFEELTFEANRFDNKRSFLCQSHNDVMDELKISPLIKNATMEVHYPPIVKVTSEHNMDVLEVNRTWDVLLNCSYEANPPPVTDIPIWYFNGRRLDQENTGYVIADTSILIKNTSGIHRGNYTCAVKNIISESNSSNSVFVNVLYPPEVVVKIEKSDIINRENSFNVTLTCFVQSGNPNNLSSVIWFFNGQQLNRSINCSTVEVNDYNYCLSDIDKLFLIRVNRSMHGNFSCQGTSFAGTGPKSPDKEFIVYYAPGNAQVTYEVIPLSGSRQSLYPVKGDRIVLRCNISDPGRPSNVSYSWYRGDSKLSNVTGNRYDIENASVKVKTNFSCQAENLGGKGEINTIHIDVRAPPSFHDASPPYVSASIYNKTINISCIVECYPTCDVYWLKNNTKIDPNTDSRYIVINKIIPENPTRDDFEAVHSMLIFNLTAWKDNELDRDNDNGNYTCESSKNEFGEGVRSVTSFQVYYPPKEVLVTTTMMNVTEHNVPQKVTCYAKATPQVKYVWINESDPTSVYTNGSMLDIKSAVSRYQAGNFICNASNEYGYALARVGLNVNYKPVCNITEDHIGERPILKCSAVANPINISYNWFMPENGTQGQSIDNSSYIFLEDDMNIERIYNCTANNTAGIGWCSLRIPSSSKWWMLFTKFDTKILIALVIGLIILFTLICVVIIIVCSRRRKTDKYKSRVHITSKQNFEGNNLSRQLSADRTLPKWPLKPGVLVHVNTTHSLSAARNGHQVSENIGIDSCKNDNRNRNGRVISYSSGSSNNNNNNNNNVNTTTSNASSKFVNRIAVGFANNFDHRNEQLSKNVNDRQKSFCNDIKVKYKADNLEGVFHGKSGVTSFKKVDSKVASCNSRKRKNPGTPAPKSKQSDDDSTTPIDPLNQPENDKTFYENLPFHGMQTPPNKQTVLSAATPEPADTIGKLPTRPSSEQSLYDGSSGYGSTRSQKITVDGKNAKDNRHPEVKSKILSALKLQENDTDRFGSLRNEKNKSEWPRFRSLRLSKNFKKPDIASSEQLQHRRNSSNKPDKPKRRVNTNNTNNNNNNSNDEKKIITSRANEKKLSHEEEFKKDGKSFAPPSIVEELPKRINFADNCSSPSPNNNNNNTLKPVSPPRYPVNSPNLNNNNDTLKPVPAPRNNPSPNNNNTLKPVPAPRNNPSPNNNNTLKPAPAPRNPINSPSPNNNNNNTNAVKPVPPPRNPIDKIIINKKQSNNVKNNSNKHTYENVPIPISPNNTANSSSDNDVVIVASNSATIENPNRTRTAIISKKPPTSSHLTNSSPIEYFRLTATNANTAIPSAPSSATIHNTTNSRLYNGSLPRKPSWSRYDTRTSNINASSVPRPPLSTTAIFGDSSKSSLRNPSSKKMVSLTPSTYQPFRPEFTDLDYADVDYRSYGPINYKAASMYAAERKKTQQQQATDDYL